MRSGFAVQSLPYAIEMSKEDRVEDESETSVLDESVESSDQKNAQKEEKGSSDEPQINQESKNVGIEDESNQGNDNNESISSPEETTEITDESVVAIEKIMGERDTTILVSTVDESQTDKEEDKAAPKETEPKVDQDDTVSSTIAVGVKAILMATGIIQAQDETKDEGKNESKDDLEQITDYIDELQRDVMSEMETMKELNDDREVTDGSLKENAEGNVDDIGSLFRPVEDALNEALNDFNATAVETGDSDDDRGFDSVDESISAVECDESDAAHESTGALSEAIEGFAC